MKVIVFDTETTGLFNRKWNIEKDNDKFPYIVQLSWICYDSYNNKIISIHDHIIKLKEGIKIPEESSKIHGITDAISKLRGEDIKTVILEFKRDLMSSDIVVGHNLNYDKVMISVELVRNGMVNCMKRLRKKELYCTMQHSKEICQIYKQGKYGPYLKFPSLIELHEYLFNDTPKNLHNSLIDVIITLRCFCKLYCNKDLITNKSFKLNYDRLCN